MNVIMWECDNVEMGKCQTFRNVAVEIPHLVHFRIYAC